MCRRLDLCIYTNTRRALDVYNARNKTKRGRAEVDRRPRAKEGKAAQKAAVCRTVEYFWRYSISSSAFFQPGRPLGLALVVLGEARPLHGYSADLNGIIRLDDIIQLG